jgi:hypothetical protein
MLEIVIGSIAAVGALTLYFGIRTYYSNTYMHIEDEPWEDCRGHGHEHRVVRGVEVSFRRNK